MDYSLSKKLSDLRTKLDIVLILILMDYSLRSSLSASATQEVES